MQDIEIEKAAFREVMGEYPTGVSVITAMTADAQPVGMVVGTFTSVSLDPPLVGFLPDRGSSTWPRIAGAGHFAVNVLSSDQTDLCRRLASKGPDKFAGIEYVLSRHGLPMLPGVLAVIECRIHSIAEAGDHFFVTGRVLAMESRRAGDPMLFHRGRFGGFAQAN